MADNDAQQQQQQGSSQQQSGGAQQGDPGKIAVTPSKKSADPGRIETRQFLGGEGA